MNKMLVNWAVHGVLAAACAGAAHAQTAAQTGPLSTFVNNPLTGASALQRSAGYAVQGMCRSLAGEGGLQLTGGKGDLFLRCNEMVETARVFEALPGGRTRSLGYTEREQLAAAVQQVSGEEIAAQGVLSTQVSAGQFANISGRLSALRVASTSAAARGRVALLDETPPLPIPVFALAARPDAHQSSGISLEGEGAEASESRLGWFVESSYGFGEHDRTANEDPFDFDSTSVTSGLDYNFGQSVLGLSIGYDRYNADFDTVLLVSGGEVEVTGLSASLFGGYFGTGWTINGIATYGALESDVTRRVVYPTQNAACAPACGASRTLTGDPDGNYVALGLTLGYEITAGGWDIAPSLSASFRDVDMDGYDETDTAGGGLALRYQEQDIESLRSILSLAISRPISRSFGVLVPALRLEWHHEFEDDPRAVGAKYVLEDNLVTGGSSAQDFGCAVSCFTMPVDRADADYGVASLGLSATFPRRVQLYFVYEALVGSSNLTGNSLAAGLRGQF